MLDDPGYAQRVDGAFASEVLATHRRLTGWRDPRGGVQLAWPRALGTPPWALAHALGAHSGQVHRVHLVLPWQRPQALSRLRLAAATKPVALYVGDRWLPRHVLLVLDATLRAYDPATGGGRLLTTTDFEEATLRPGRWTHPWFWIG
ncbi:hypothetical protein [Nocardioides daejeonensis]|uniref:hypothetical protein n=1 Tax=Nocardioides daejeonensis TaxID=1046556 RepID=UPI000D74E8B8|nr:hypothetical protein [Nocardioides daejeonensis]